MFSLGILRSLPVRSRRLASSWAAHNSNIGIVALLAHALVSNYDVVTCKVEYITLIIGS